MLLVQKILPKNIIHAQIAFVINVKNYLGNIY